ncbi:MAG: M42 family metallopeptidase [Mycobacterium leprae]
MELLERLRLLVSLTAPSGQEEDTVRFLLPKLRDAADEVTVDPLGNVIAVKKGKSGGRRLLLSAHMDEIGFIVRKVEADGYLRFEKLGGHDDRILLAQRVWVRGSKGRLAGVIGCKSAHLSGGERDKLVKHPEMYMDIGARSAAEVAAMGVTVGDPVGYMSELAELGLASGRFIAHGLDDRAGCALLWHLLDDLKGTELPGDLVLVFSVQEEVGLRGARTAAQAMNADVALAVDMTAADDTPDTGTRWLQLGKGPAIKVMDNSLLAHPAMRRAMVAAAERAGVTTQAEILTGIGTDAGAIHQSGGGVVTGALSVANRYTHSPVEMFDRADLEGAYRLLREVVLGIEGADLSFVGQA